MRTEVYENAISGEMEMEIFNDDNELVAACALVESLEDAQNMDTALENDPTAYLTWDCYHAGNIEKASEDNIEKYDEDGNPVDLKEHPWTLQELHEDVVGNSWLIKPYYVFETSRYAEYEEGHFYKLEDSVRHARLLWSKLTDHDKALTTIDIRQFEYAYGSEEWEDCYDHDSFDWHEPYYGDPEDQLDEEEYSGNEMAATLEGEEVTVMFGNIRIKGTVVLVDDGVMHINFQ